MSDPGPEPQPPPDRDRVRGVVVVSGLVQGVCFRASALEEARRLGLAGEVRNLPDGSVELIAEGERRAVEELVAWSRRGPPAARVEGVQVRWAAARGGFKTFRIAR